MTAATSRSEFAARQAAMTAQWGQNACNRSDAEALFSRRKAAYLDRWAEALRFVPDGSRLLDIGGGNGFAELYELMRARRIDYHYLDVDPGAVASSKAIAEACGLDAAQFGHGFNDELPHADASFDFVFSSHCIEHSFNLRATFTEVRRVLRPSGSLLMAVPFGWELNPEHPYFFGPNEWLALLQDAGFEIRTAQIGKEYPEQGYDYFVCARRLDAVPQHERIDPALYTKAAYTYAPTVDLTLTTRGSWKPAADGIIGAPGASATWLPPADASVILPVFYRHDWSGVVEARWGDRVVREDLFSWNPYPMPIRIARGAGEDALELRSISRSAASFSSEIVLVGIMYA